METREWNYMDKSDWPRGEWDNEPDKVQWLDEETNLPCLVVRNHSGALCGYVGVSEGHPFFGRHYDDVGCPDVHGGLTFSDTRSPHADNPEGENDNVWWLGFDCAHAYDLMPSYSGKYDAVSPEDVYRNVPYVQDQCRHLAQQLSVATYAPRAATDSD